MVTPAHWLPTDDGDDCVGAAWNLRRFQLNETPDEIHARLGQTELVQKIRRQQCRQKGDVMNAEEIKEVMAFNIKIDKKILIGTLESLQRDIMRNIESLQNGIDNPCDTCRLNDCGIIQNAPHVEAMVGKIYARAQTYNEIYGGGDTK